MADYGISDDDDFDVPEPVSVQSTPSRKRGRPAKRTLQVSDVQGVDSDSDADDDPAVDDDDPAVDVVAPSTRASTSDDDDDDTIEVGQIDYESIKPNVSWVVVDYEGQHFPGMVTNKTKKVFEVNCLVVDGTGRGLF